MESIEEKIARLAPELSEPRLAQYEEEWLAGFVTQPRYRSTNGMISASACAAAMALVIGVFGAGPARISDYEASGSEMDPLSPFSVRSPLAPSTLLAE